jgi:hypothetical protein
VTPFEATAATHRWYHVLNHVRRVEQKKENKTKGKLESRTAEIPQRELGRTTSEGRARSSTTNGIPRVMDVQIGACLTPK